MDDALSILAELRQLLDRYGYEDRAGFVKEVIDSRISSMFWPTLAGLEFWGGSGALGRSSPFI
jgi:hypothetical protein